MKAKQAGQLTKFMDLIESMGGVDQSDAADALTDPQDLGRTNELKIEDADDNAVGG